MNNRLILSLLLLATLEIRLARYCRGTPLTALRKQSSAAC